MPHRIIVIAFLCALVPATGVAQVRDSARVIASDTVPAKSDSLPHWGDLAQQFIAGEIAFNATSFLLWGDDLYAGRTDKNMLAGAGVVVS